MNNKYFKIVIPALISGAILFSGCSASAAADNIKENKTTVIAQTSTSSVNTDANLDSSEYFSARDLSGEIDYTDAVEIAFNGNKISSSSDAVSISGTNVIISEEGTYILSGNLDDGSVIVDTSKEGKVQLVLNGVSINSDTFAPIYVKQADKVFVTLAGGTDNTLTNGGSFEQVDENNVDAVIFAKDDITLNGSGSLTVSSPAGKGVVGKDELTITGGTYKITSSKSAISANDSIAISDGTFSITSNSDGIHAKNSDDDSLGKIVITGGDFTINAGSDGIEAISQLQIDGGRFDISAAEGLESTYVVINDGEINISASDDGINAAQKSSQSTPIVEINGGNITIVMGQGDTDGVDSNGDIVINGGTVDVTGNSTFDYNGSGTINGGTVIANGQEITTLPNQMMGGHGGFNGGGMGGHGDFNGGEMGGHGNFNGGGMGNHGNMGGQNGMGSIKGTGSNITTGGDTEL